MKAWLWVILLLGFLIRIAAAWVWQSYNVGENYLRFGDSDSYWHLARTIATGEPYQYGSPNTQIFRAPLYPIFLTPFASMVPDGDKFSWAAVFCARIAGCLAGVGCVAMLAWLTTCLYCFPSSCDDKSIDNSPTTNIDCRIFYKLMIGTGILAVLYPGAVGMSVLVLSEAVFCPLMIASLGATLFAIQTLRHANPLQANLWMFAAGILSGAACLSRPSWSLWPAILFPYLAIVIWKTSPPSSMLASNSLSVRQKFQAWTLNCFLFCFGIIVCMSPWWIRNYRVSGMFVPTTLQVGASLYDGWHPGASGSSDENMAFVDRYAHEQEQADRLQQNGKTGVTGTFEWRLDRRLRNAAIAWARENSSAAARLGLVKWVKTWSPMPSANELGSSVVRWAEAIGYSAIMLLAALGIGRLRNQPGAWLFIMPAIYFAILHMFFIGSVRYRQPAVLVLCVVAGVGLVICLDWIQQTFKRSKKKVEGSTAPKPYVTVDTSNS